MKTPQGSIIKTLSTSGLSIALLGTLVGCATVAPPHDNRPIYRNSHAITHSHQLPQDLHRKVYNDHRNKDVGKKEHRNKSKYKDRKHDKNKNSNDKRDDRRDRDDDKRYNEKNRR
ncbi:hypothetical protein [Psychrobacter sp.]|uniref:hypothetical protein n=1 Tax=Psychrobacter sp. TaxID=56811 RepID=UPI003F9B995F